MGVMLASKDVLNPCWGSRDRIADMFASRVGTCLDRDRALGSVRSNLKDGCRGVCMYLWGKCDQEQLVESCLNLIRMSYRC